LWTILNLKKEKKRFREKFGRTSNDVNEQKSGIELKHHGDMGSNHLLKLKINSCGGFHRTTQLGEKNALRLRRWRSQETSHTETQSSPAGPPVKKNKEEIRKHCSCRRKGDKSLLQKKSVGKREKGAEKERRGGRARMPLPLWGNPT